MKFNRDADNVSEDPTESSSTSETTCHGNAMAMIAAAPAIKTE